MGEHVLYYIGEDQNSTRTTNIKELSMRSRFNVIWKQTTGIQHDNRPQHGKNEVDLATSGRKENYND